MAIPRVFISSTCYDLKYIRENLKYFINTLGYEPILSEDGDVFYNPKLHTHDSCLSEVSTCQIFVLIIGGRYGGEFKKSSESITNNEYKEAVSQKLPVFALVESSVYNEHNVYNENKKKNVKINANDITYPSVDNIKIFEFIDEVRKNVINNAIFPFSNFLDIENYLKKQWAGMMHYYITAETEAKRVNQLFETISEATQKIEFFTRQIVTSVGNKLSTLNVEFYDYMIGHDVIHDLAKWNLKPSPRDFLIHNTLDSFTKDNIQITRAKDDSLTHGGPPYKLSQKRYDYIKDDYSAIWKHINKRLEEEKISVKEFIGNDISA